MAEKKIEITKEAEMMMEEYLLSKGMSLDALTKAKQDRYKKVAEAVYRIKSIRKQAEQCLRNYSINISAIAEETGISNKTFYNDYVLNDFIKENSTKDSNDKSSQDSLLLAELKDIKRQNHSLVRSAIETQLLKEEIKELEKDNANLNLRLDASEELIDQLQAELKHFRTSHECELIDMKTGKRQIIQE